MADETVKLRAEIEELAAMGKFGDKLKTIADNLRELSSVTANYNSKGKITTVVLKGLTNALNEVQTKLGSNGGIRQLSETAFGNLDQRIAKANRELERLVRNGAKLQHDAIRQNTKWENEEALAVQQIHQRLFNHAQQLSRKKIQLENEEAMAIQTIRQRLAAHAVKVANQTNASTARATAAASMGGVPNATTPLQNVALNSAMNSATAPIAAGKVSVAQFQQMITAVKNGTPQAFQAVNAAQAQALNGLTRYAATIARVGIQNQNVTRSMVLDWGNVIRIFQVQALHQVFGALINEFKQAGTTAKQFTLDIDRIRTISQDTSVSTKEWNSELKQLSVNLNVPLLEVSAAAYSAVSNQVAKGTETVGFLNEAFMFSKITGSTAKESVDLLSFAMNAFKLKADEAHKVSAILFKTIDLGNVTAKDMAETFGATAPLAHQAGLSIQEFAASIVTLTIQGLKFDTANTFTRNVLKEMIKPSKEMQALLKEWGFNSGEAAIKTLTFAGVLKKLQDEAKGGGLARIAEIFPDIRGTLGAIGIFGGQNLEIFNNAMSKFAGSMGDLEEAFKMIHENAGQKLESDLNRLKVAFTDLGEEALRTGAGISDIFKATAEIGGAVKGEGGSGFVGFWKELNNVIDTSAKNMKKFAGEFSSLHKELGIPGLNIGLPSSPTEMMHNLANFMRDPLGNGGVADKTINGNTKPIKGIEPDAELQRLNIALKESQNELDALLGEDTLQKKEKNFTKLSEKIHKELLKLKFDFKEFKMDLIGEDEISRLDHYADRIKDLKNFNFFDVKNIDEARERFDAILSTAQKLNQEISTNINKGLSRIASLDRKQEASSLAKELKGKSPKQQADIYRKHAEQTMAKAMAAKDFDDSNRLFDEAEAFAKKRSELKQKLPGSKIKGGVVKDDLEDKIFAAAKKKAQEFVDANKAKAVDLNDLAKLKVNIEEKYLAHQEQEITNAKRILQVQEAINTAIQKRMNPQGAPAAGVGKAANGFPGFAVGGMISGPMGRDNLLIRAHAGEFVVNSDATSKFYPQLMAMNSGFAPRAFANGGPVTNTNVGDININVKSQEANVRDIGYKLQRAIKRGTLRLS